MSKKDQMSGDSSDSEPSQFATRGGYKKDGAANKQGTTPGLEKGD